VISFLIGADSKNLVTGSLMRSSSENGQSGFVGSAARPIESREFVFATRIPRTNAADHRQDIIAHFFGTVRDPKLIVGPLVGSASGQSRRDPPRHARPLFGSGPELFEKRALLIESKRRHSASVGRSGNLSAL
jgi:hypothetical protein